ncbi:MAG: 2OG-Fe(II) oxygenase [Gammaproteobacteria bacterium]|nr:2OG-Fe(II) oxygenase [Gammaproteobacteria bacterium]
MSGSDSIFDFQQLASLTLGDDPFRYLVHDGSVLVPGVLDALTRDFPQLQSVGHVESDKAELSDSWKAFVAAVRSDAYREAMERITGLSLAGLEVGIGLRRLSKASHGKPHVDVPRKKVTHLIYFNETWPHPTGRLHILRSRQLRDSVQAVEPLKGTGVIFVVAKNSFHGFEPFEGIRQAVQINFQSRRGVRDLFSRY